MGALRKPDRIRVQRSGPWLHRTIPTDRLLTVVAVYESLTGRTYETREQIRGVASGGVPAVLVQVVDFSFRKVPLAEVSEVRASVSRMPTS